LGKFEDSKQGKAEKGLEISTWKVRAKMNGGSYQTLMNEALKQFAQGLTLATIVRETIRQELHQL
jgi:hypothetical protein